MNNLHQRLFHLLSGAWRRRYVIVLPILLLPLVGLMVGVFSPKHYSAHTSMLIQETAKMNPFLEDLAVSAMLKERMAALKTLLHSRHILGSVAQELGIVDGHTEPARYDRVIARLSGALSVQMAGKDLIRIDYRSDRPDSMRQTLEAVSRHFIEQLLAPERSSMRDSSDFLAEHLAERRRELELAEASLADFKDRHAGELPELHSSNINRLVQLKQRLSEREAELAGAGKSLGGLDQQLSSTNPVVGRIEEQIVRIRGELALLRARYTDQHSKVQGALRNLRRLEQERKTLLNQQGPQLDSDRLWDIASSAQSGDQAQPLLISQLEDLQEARGKVDALSEETRRLKEMIAELEAKTAGFGAQEKELRKIERDLEVKRKLYEELLARYEMARVSGSLGVFEQEKRIKIIDQPFTPTAPDNLPLPIFVAAGLFGGLFLGLGLAVLLEVTDTSIRRRDRLEELTGVPVLSRIPPLQATSNSPIDLVD